MQKCRNAEMHALCSAGRGAIPEPFPGREGPRRARCPLEGAAAARSRPARRGLGTSMPKSRLCFCAPCRIPAKELHLKQQSAVVVGLFLLLAAFLRNFALSNCVKCFPAGLPFAQGFIEFVTSCCLREI